MRRKSQNLNSTSVGSSRKLTDIEELRIYHNVLEAFRAHNIVDGNLPATFDQATTYTRLSCRRWSVT